MGNQNHLVYGIRPITEAIEGGKEIDRVLLRKQGGGEAFNALFKLIRKKNIPFQYVPDTKLNSLTEHPHQGAVAFLSMLTYADIDKVKADIISKGGNPWFLMLDRVTDVRNFGAIARTAECAGVDALIIQEKGAAKINAEAIKASAGALLRIAVCRVPNLIHYGTTLLQDGFTLISVTEKGNEFYYDADYSGSICIILGSEENGISPPLLKMSDRKLKIPQYGSIGSLNVSIAGGIALFEASKKRNAQK